MARTNYTLSGADAFAHKPEHPERTSRKAAGTGLNFDVAFKVWSSRETMARAIRAQQKRERQHGDWTACVPLSTGEGF